MKETFLVLSAVISIISVVPYLVGIIKGSTKPNIVSWLTWTLLTGMATAAAFTAGEYEAAIFTGSATLATASIVILGLKFGFAKYTKFDAFCQASTLVGLGLWLLFNSPAIGVIAAVTIDFIGALPTIRHAYQAPHEETWQTFAMSVVAGLLALLALHTYNWVSLPYAIYIVVINIIICGVILFAERRRIAHDLS